MRGARRRRRAGGIRDLAGRDLGDRVRALVHVLLALTRARGPRPACVEARIGRRRARGKLRGRKLSSGAAERPRSGRSSIIRSSTKAARRRRAADREHPAEPRIERRFAAARRAQALSPAEGRRQARSRRTPRPCNAPPSWRKNPIAAVVVPISCGSTAFCTATVVIGSIVPMPTLISARIASRPDERHATGEKRASTRQPRHRDERCRRAAGACSARRATGRARR